ncbi:hypothetical protein BD414DRAFT_472204 [Trametes punicea]|nr:hypothetical protein BD414DRAFT_472204 [Trametes punicea]
MFKRVEKRIRKKQREEELGLDPDVKEMLGINDIDSDDSDSSSSESEDGSDKEKPSLLHAGDEAGESSDDEEDEKEGLDEDGGEEEEEMTGLEGLGDNYASQDESGEEEGAQDDAPMSVPEALQNPIYLVSLEPEVKACIVCPGKLLKNPVMTDVHLQSNAHTRRFARLRQAAMDVAADTDVRQLLRTALAPQPPTKPAEGMSKRAAKKKAKLEAVKAKRAKQKIMKAKARARKEAKLNAAASEDAAELNNPKTSQRPPTSRKRKAGDGGEDEAPKTAVKRLKASKLAQSKIDMPSKAAKESEKPRTPAPKTPEASSAKAQAKVGSKSKTSGEVKDGVKAKRGASAKDDLKAQDSAQGKDHPKTKKRRLSATMAS